MRLREFAPAGGGGSGDYFQALASAWYNGTFDTGSLQKGIKSQEDVERLLNRGIVCPDGKTRKLHIDYNSDFDGVEIYSDDYYEYGDHDDTIDSRTGQKWGPYDFMAFSDEDLSEGVSEGVRTESAELAKQYGWAYNQGEYGASMTHPKHGRISLSSPVTSRSGDTAVEREWTHNNASGVGDRSLAQHLQSLKEQDVEEGIFGSKPNPVLPIVAKIDKVARELTPQNVETGKQIIQSQTRDITRMLSPQSKAGVDVIEQGVAEAKDDYVPPKEADYGKKYQAMVLRVGEKARAQEKAKQQQQPKAPVRESRRELLKQIIQS